MTRFKVLLGAGLLLALLLAGGLWIAQANGVSPHPSALPPPVHSTFNVANSYVSGSPAIQPRSSASTSGAAFTEDDVKAFFNKNGFFAGPVVQGAHMKFVTIQFVSAQQASQLMRGESVERPDTYLVCYVEVEGPFHLNPISQPRGTKKVDTAEFGDAVFDAHTGNLLVWGFYP